MTDTTLDHTPASPPTSSSRRGALLGAMFLMATSAIGPGFITQTTTFTAKLGAAMAFAILVSVLVDIAIQLNVWRIVGVSGRRVPIGGAWTRLWRMPPTWRPGEERRAGAKAWVVLCDCDGAGTVDPQCCAVSKRSSNAPLIRRQFSQCQDEFRSVRLRRIAALIPAAICSAASSRSR